MRIFKNIVSKTLIAGAALLTFSVHAQNEDRIGAAGASELLINPWARSAGLGDAGIATTKGLESQHLNIAGLAFTDRTQIKFNYTNWLGSAGVSLNSAGIAQRVSDQDVVAVSVQAFGYGDIDITTVQNPEGNIGTFSPRKNILGLGYAREFSNSIYAGLNVKIISEQISNLRASGVALDAGVKYVTGEQDQINFGITLKNVGPTMVFRGDGLNTPIFYQSNGAIATLNQRPASFEMPSLLQLGGGYDFIFNESNKLTTAIGFTANSFTNNQFRFGLDYHYSLGESAAFNMRAGYVLEENVWDADLRTTALAGPTAGVSVDVLTGANKSPIGFEYAVRQASVFGWIHTFGITISLK